MKIATIICRILLGLLFVFAGSAPLFMKMPAPPPTPAGQFMNALVVSHYLFAICLVDLVGGLMLIIGRFVPLGLTLLAPVIFNIVCYHLFLDTSGLPLAIGVAAVEAFLIWRHREAFAGLLKP